MMRWISAAVAVATAFVLSACGPSALVDAYPPPRPLGADLPAFRPPREPPPAGARAAPDEAPTGLVTLRQAMAAALLHNPDLAGAAWAVRVEEARALQAGLPPNPSLGVEVEEAFGSGPRRDLDAAETTIPLSQVFSLGGVVERRARVAGLTAELAGWDYELDRIQVLAGVSRRFVDVLAAQQRIGLADNAMQTVEAVLDAVQRRIAAGQVSPVEGTQARVMLARSRIHRDITRRQLASARRRLAATWGATAPLFDAVDGALAVLPPLPAFASLEELIEQSPRMARWTTDMARRRAAIELARAEGVPEVEVGIGLQHFNESDDNAAVFEVGVPLPLFDRNQGNVLAARLERARAQARRKADDVRVRTAVAVTYDTLAAAHAEATALRAEVLPAARAAFSAAEQAYRLGKIDYVGVLDSQRTLIETEGQLIDALAACHGAAIDLEELIGQSLGSVGTETAGGKEYADETGN